MRGSSRARSDDGADLGVRLLERRPVSEPRDRHDVGARLVDRRRVRDAERRPELRGEERRREPARHHADDRVGIAVKLDGPADNRGIAAEPPLPGAVTEDDEPLFPGFLVVGEQAAEDWPCGGQPQHLRAHRHGIDDRRVAAAGENAIGGRERGEMRQRAAALAEPHQIDGVQRIAVLRVRQTRRHQIDRDRPIAAVQRYRPEERRVDGGEERGVDTDDERERRDTGGGVGPPAPQRANGLAEFEHASSIGPWSTCTKCIVFIMMMHQSNGRRKAVRACAASPIRLSRCEWRLSGPPALQRRRDHA